MASLCWFTFRNWDPGTCALLIHVGRELVSAKLGAAWKLCLNCGSWHFWGERNGRGVGSLQSQ